MSQEQLALAAGLAPAYLGMIERGGKNPTINVIEQICGVLRISLADFFNYGQLNIAEQDDTMLEIVSLLEKRSPQEKEAVLKIIKNVLEMRDI